MGPNNKIGRRSILIGRPQNDNHAKKKKNIFGAKKINSYN